METEIQKKIIVLSPNVLNQQTIFVIENAVQIGIPIIFENAGESIESIFEPILQKKIIRQGAVQVIKMWDKVVDYNSDFRFYITTKLSRPHYSPEICVKVAMLNFMVTLDGLED